jgi:hypothetical protein
MTKYSEEVAELVEGCRVHWYAETRKDGPPRYHATIYPESRGGELARLLMTDVDEATFRAALVALVGAIPVDKRRA